MRLLTPPGLAGIAVLAVDRSERAAVAAALRTKAGGAAAPIAGGAPIRAEFVIDGEVVDDVLALVRSDGQLELHVHGAPAVIDAIDRRFGVDIAQPIGPAEALLRTAMCKEQLELALEQRGFAFDRELARLAELPRAERDAAIAAVRRRSRVALALSEPARVALIGRQNAGKSSLFNRLLFRERALTGDHPGLTRDAIAETTTLAGYPYELIDTAGEGEVAADADAAAIARGRALRRDALVVLVVDGSVGIGDIDRALLAEASLVVRTKADLPAGQWPADAPCDAVVSARVDDPGELRQRIGELLRGRRRLPLAGPVGGFAALDAGQLRRLEALAGDGTEPAPPA